jgi:hypothetical protein
MKKWVLVLGLLLGSSQLAVACEDTRSGPRGHGGPPHGRLFVDMDADKDGVVTRQEAAEFQQKRFNEVDTNKDGKITQDEVEAFVPPRPDRR